MRELEALLNKRWILKAEDKELYYKVQRSAWRDPKICICKAGCHIIENALLVKLEKIPVIPESFMGVQEFTSKQEYAFLCLLLMFLEDKDPQEQFILSQLTEYVSSNMPNGSVDWTLYANRRRMIKVLRFAQSFRESFELQTVQIMALWMMPLVRCSMKILVCLAILEKFFS